jgi:transcriptional regulator with XRE-family HTH domain
MAKKWTNLKKKMSPAAQARVDARVKKTLESMPLDELRKAVGLTQEQIAETMDVRQGSVSKIENATDMYMSTLRRFVAALGGKLVIKATFPKGREIEIEHVASLSEQHVSSKPARSTGRKKLTA